jgi:hypothetical protein
VPRPSPSTGTARRAVATVRAGPPRPRCEMALPPGLPDLRSKRSARRTPPGAR